MSAATKAIDAQRLTLILNDLRLPAIKQAWPEFVARADTEAWPAARLLAALAEHEIAERDRRRIERHLLDARLPPVAVTMDSGFSRTFRAGRVGVTRHGERGRGGVRFQRDRTSSASASSGGCFVPRQDWSSMAA